MVDVQFEENQQFGSSGGFRSRRVFGAPTTPSMVRFLMKLGIKDEKTAGYVLVGVAVAALAVSLYIWFGVFGGEGGRGVPGGPPPGSI